MLNLNQAKRILVVGGGTAGWLAALEMRHSFPDQVEVVLLESEAIGILGAGEGSIPNFDIALRRYGLDRKEFMEATQATYKLGVRFDGWRGISGDRYFHLFSTRRSGVSLMDWRHGGFFPYSTALMSQGTAPGDFPAARNLVERCASQDEVASHLAADPQEPFAYHFDARRLAAYLRAKAEAAGVRRVDAIVQGFHRDDTGMLLTAVTDKGEFAADFFVDASGFAGLIHRKLLGIEWESFSDSLLLDRAMPFFLPNSTAHPPLVTVSQAMRNGWKWVIPTQGRLGCGYVYSSQFATESEILAELRAELGQEVEPIANLRFSPGKLRMSLSHNAVAVGLASGFVEPLEATSIAQTIYQLVMFGSLVQETEGLISDRIVEIFNREVSNGWDGIQDFLILHYDGARKDSPFWAAARAAAKPARYRELMHALGHRTPRQPDLLPYFMGGQLIFGIPSWETVAWAMGHITQETARRQLSRMGADDLTRIETFSRTMAS